MNKWLKRGMVAALGLGVVAAAAVITGVQLSERKMNRRIALPAHEVALAGDAATLDRGRYLYASRGCADCHGADGAGRIFVDEANGLKLGGPQIAAGKASVTAAYTTADWERTVRHGVKPDGRPVLIMPSEDYNRYTDTDLGAIVAYVRSMAPVDGRPAVLQLPLPVRVLYGFGVIPDAASRIDHGLPPAAPVPEGETVAHGAYVANMCIGCHGAGLSGGKIAGGPPSWPAAANLTPGAGTSMTRYADPDVLAQMFRTGKRPDGSKVGVMPFESLSKLNGTDIRALYAFLKSLPPREAGHH